MRQRMANRHPGRCATCGEWVEEGAGWREHSDGEWVTIHKTGKCGPSRAANNLTDLCAKCGGHVQPKAGWREQTAAGEWQTVHRDGKCIDGVKRPERSIINRYGGTCAVCGQPVPAWAGFAYTTTTGTKTTWAVVHPTPATCIAATPPARAWSVEQQDALGASLDGGHLALQAGAGCGKTTLVIEMVKRSGRLTVLMTFNKTNQLAAQERMPKNGTAFTIHAYAFRSCGIEYKPRIDARMRGERTPSWQMAKLIGANGFGASKGNGGSKWFTNGWVAQRAIDGALKFAQSADQILTVDHMPWVEAIDYDGSGENPGRLQEHLLPLARRVWEDWCNPAGELPYETQAYIKQWTLAEMAEPSMWRRYETIIVDEAQDLQPCTIAAITANAAHAQIIAVGDSKQAINTWMGSADALPHVAALPGAREIFLPQTYRFGDDVAALANEILDRLPDNQLHLRGNPKTDTRIWYTDSEPDGDPAPIPKPQAIIARTTAGVFAAALGELATPGRKVHIVGEIDNFLRDVEAVDALRERDRLRDLYAVHPIDTPTERARKTRALEEKQKQLRGLDHAGFAAFDSFDELLRHALEAEDAELSLLLDLIEEFETDELLSMKGRCCKDAEEADITITTCHKAKGSEWEHIQLAEDWTIDRIGGPGSVDRAGKEKPINSEEHQLLYVAVTRCRTSLDLTRTAIVEQIRRAHVA